METVTTHEERELLKVTAAAVGAGILQQDDREKLDDWLIERDAYNGWKNYPTWAVNLWLGNDQELYNATLEIVGQGLTYADDHPNVPSIWTQDEANRFAVADALKTWVTDELAPDLGASFASDLLGYALGEVDWEEIANAWLDARDQ